MVALAILVPNPAAARTRPLTFTSNALAWIGLIENLPQQAHHGLRRLREEPSENARRGAEHLAAGQRPGALSADTMLISSET
jgi:hypothetical protein